MVERLTIRNALPQQNTDAPNAVGPCVCERCGVALRLAMTYFDDAVLLGNPSIVGAEPSCVEEHIPVRLCSPCHQRLGAFMDPTESTLAAENPYNGPNAPTAKRTPPSPR